MQQGNIKHIISFSGGKDSTALVLWAIENLPEFETIYCDTKWEDKATYEYIQYINQELLDNKLIALQSDKYGGFEDMCIKKKRVPSVLARYCTEELKVKPTQKYIRTLQEQGFEVKLYLGIRAEESKSRAQLKPPFYHDLYKCLVELPLFHWTWQSVFDIHKLYQIKPNPLYSLGMKRVGCMPCIMCNLEELRAIIKYRPEALERLRNLEETVGRTFFAPNKIPVYARTGIDIKTGIRIPTIDDVVNYLTRNEPPSMFDEEAETCMSYYNLCE